MITVSLLDGDIVMGAVAVWCAGILVCSVLPAPHRVDTVDHQLDRPRYILRPDLPEVLVGDRQPRPIGRSLAGRLQRDEAMERLVGERDAQRDRASALETYAGELARHLVAIGERVPALPQSEQPVLDETEAGAR